MSDRPELIAKIVSPEKAAAEMAEGPALRAARAEAVALESARAGGNVLGGRQLRLNIPEETGLPPLALQTAVASGRLPASAIDEWRASQGLAQPVAPPVAEPYRDPSQPLPTQSLDQVDLAMACAENVSQCDVLKRWAMPLQVCGFPAFGQFPDHLKAALTIAMRDGATDPLLLSMWSWFASQCPRAWAGPTLTRFLVAAVGWSVALRVIQEAFEQSQGLSSSRDFSPPDDTMAQENLTFAQADEIPVTPDPVTVIDDLPRPRRPRSQK